jgi:DNA-binding response OmpR family regulator
LPFVRALHGVGIAVLERDEDAAGIRLALSGEFDLVAADCADDCDGLNLSRIADAGVPVIALFDHATSRCASAALTAGADACLQLDADAQLVVAQVRAVLRRHGAFAGSTGVESGVLQVGDLYVDVDRCEVQRAGANVALTATEFRIIEFMARSPGRVLRPHEILNAVSDDYEYLPREAQDVFKVYVRRIRRKLEISEEEPSYLITVRGFGYRLEGGAKSVSERRTAVGTA